MDSAKVKVAAAIILVSVVFNGCTSREEPAPARAAVANANGSTPTNRNTGKEVTSNSNASSQVKAELNETQSGSSDELDSELEQNGGPPPPPDAHGEAQKLLDSAFTRSEDGEHWYTVDGESVLVEYTKPHWVLIPNPLARDEPERQHGIDWYGWLVITVKWQRTFNAATYKWNPLEHGWISRYVFKKVDGEWRTDLRDLKPPSLEEVTAMSQGKIPQHSILPVAFFQAKNVATRVREGNFTVCGTDTVYTREVKQHCPLCENPPAPEVIVTEHKNVTVYASSGRVSEIERQNGVKLSISVGIGTRDDTKRRFIRRFSTETMKWSPYEESGYGYHVSISYVNGQWMLPGDKWKPLEIFNPMTCEQVRQIPGF